ncbi:MAG TPA: MBL fold metallo-hydrolase [Ignavibacteria bacterium]|nr:MBL fold metallo-hydrolase [Ignavibacteria bacterium]
MVKITFKNVGQGDSILIEWNSNNKLKTAIVDCNLYQSANPTLDYIIQQEIKEIEFIILSHPHTDHFSGFYELLEYCRNNQVRINRFLHTSQVTPDFLKSATRSLEADEELFKLFNLLRIMRDNDEIKIYTIDDNPNLIIPLGDTCNMEVLSPSSTEIDKYIRGVKFPFDEEESTSNPNANWLSTILKIYNDKACVILTSDVESTALTRIGKKKSGRVGNDKMVMAQIPHHGSKGNLNKPFWQMRRRNEHTPVVISVGENDFRHPSLEVIVFFDKTTNYEIVSTNLTGALSKESAETRQISQILDIVSTNISAKMCKKRIGDKVFIFNGESCKMVH